MTLTLITCLVADAAAVNEIARQMQIAAGGGDGGQYSFTVPLYEAAATDDSTPIRYWAGVNFQPEFKAQAEGYLTQYPNCTMDDYDPVANPGFPDQKLTALGLRRGLLKTP